MKLTRILSAGAIALVALTGCHKHHDPYPTPAPTPTPTPTPTPEETFRLTERSDWKITYVGRDDYPEADGTVTRVENFGFKYTGNTYFIFRFLTETELKELYGNVMSDALKEFFTVEAEAVVAAAGEGNFYDDASHVFDATQTEILFDLMIHGEYLGYMIELDGKGKATGNYAATTFVVEEERALDAYLKWVGTYHVADRYSGFDIEVSPCENNYLYYIDGWETGSAVSEQMNMDRDWIYARYRNNTGMLYFYGQYLMTYEETFSDGVTTTVDEMFVGTYLTSSSDSNGEVDGEGADYGYDIAHTVIAEDGSITVDPESFTFDNGFEATYHSMRYSRYCYDEQNWAHYNTSGVPSLPLVMTAIPSVKAAIHAPAVRKVTRATVHRNQPRRHQQRPVRTFSK